MKIFYKLLIILVVVVICSCGLEKMENNVYKIQYEVTPDTLKVYDGKVPIKIVIIFPKRYFKKRAYMQIAPYIVSKDGLNELKLKIISLQGEKVLDDNPVINFQNGGKYIYRDTVQYNPIFSNSELQLRYSLTKTYMGSYFVAVNIANGILQEEK